MTLLSLSTETIVWMALPFFLGFSMTLVPHLARYLALGVALASVGYAMQIFISDASLTLHLLDHAGVALWVDSLSGFFILTNGLVTAAVVLYCWHRDSSSFFYTQLIILHG
ncbi:MAG: cation:proton antiporter, partial [Cyanobacteria bacterium P01_A01_bin.123]